MATPKSEALIFHDESGALLPCFKEAYQRQQKRMGQVMDMHGAECREAALAQPGVDPSLINSIWPERPWPDLDTDQVVCKGRTGSKRSKAVATIMSDGFVKIDDPENLELWLTFELPKGWVYMP